MSDAGATVDKLTVLAVGGPTVVLDFGGLRFITDPTFDPPGGEYPRAVPPPLTKTEGPAVAADVIGGIDAVLLSHDHHWDNLDRAGRAFVERAERVLTTTAGAERLGGNAIGLEPWSSVDLPRAGGAALTVTAVPAQHGPAGADHLTGPVIGFVLMGEGLPSLYVSGDNASVDVVRRIVDRVGRIELAILFAGGARLPQFDDYLTLSSERAVEVTTVLGARAVIPVHHDGWSHLSEGIDSLRAAFDAAGIGERLIVPEPGNSVTV